MKIFLTNTLFVPTNILDRHLICCFYNVKLLFCD